MPGEAYELSRYRRCALASRAPAARLYHPAVVFHKNADELFRDPRRARVHRRLRLLGEGPAAFYRDACRILDAETGAPAEPVREQSVAASDAQAPMLRLVAAAHLVAHLFRELESAIRDVLLPLDAQIDKDHRHRDHIDAILRAYELDQDVTLVQAWHRLRGPEDSSLHKRAHRNNLDRPRPLNESARHYFSDVEAVFDAVLERFEERFTDSLAVVDLLIAKHPPIKSDLDLLRNRVPNNLITLHHFFSQAEDPAWLDLLARKDAFATPPEPMTDEDDGVSVMQPWPASQYLARMARVPELQERVVRIALAVPSTQNARVHEDLADVALAVPVQLALQFVGPAKTWCQDPWFSRVADKIVALIEKFLGDGEVDAALHLSEALFDPENRTTGNLESGHEAWEYEQSVKKLVPPLVAAGGLRALGIFTTCLLKLVRADNGSERLEKEEYSYIWRPAIETHDQNLHGSDARQALIDAVRDGAQSLGTSTELLAVVQQLEAAESPLLNRVALHLLRVAPEVPSDLIASHLLDRERLHNSNSWHEYTLLARDRLPDLQLDEQLQIVRWAVEHAIGRAREERPGEAEESADPEVTERRVRAFEHGALERFRGVVPADFQARHEELEREFGKAEHPEFLTYHGEGWLGEPSPKAADELWKLSVGELIDYLKSWTPPTDQRRPMSASREGLAREMGNLVATDPARFAHAAHSFLELHPLYVRSLIGGLVGAARKGSRFEWKPVLELCASVVGESAMAEPADEGSSLGDSWAGARSEAASLIEHGFPIGPCELPFECRAEIWSTLERLGGDLDPTPQREAAFLGSNSSAYDLAINSTRGTALGAAIQYGLWVRRHAGGSCTDFDFMPELRSFLELHLDTAIDPSIAVRSVYGRWLPWLHFLDSPWTGAHLQQILPEEAGETDHRQAAWNAYILYCQPYSDVFPLLAEAHAWAVGELEHVDAKARHSPEEHLAEHLLVYYLRGLLELRSPLLASFFEHASGAIRRHALRFVGRVLYDSGDIDAELKARAMALWEARTADLDVGPMREKHLELEAFGWWFAASSIDSSWRIAQLSRVLSQNPVVEPDRLVFEQLLALVSAFPLEVLGSLRKMIEGAANRWKTFSWRRELRQILEAALRLNSAEVTGSARAIVSLLVARGEIEYRTLLDPAQNGLDGAAG